MIIHDYHILSYHRATAIRTPYFLRECGVPDEKIHIYLNDDDEVQAYLTANPKLSGCNFVSMPGVKNAQDARNYITRYWGKTPLIVMDDDVIGFKFLVNNVSGGKPTMADARSIFQEYISRAIKLATAKGCGIVGFITHITAKQAAKNPEYLLNEPVYGMMIYVNILPNPIPPWCIVTDDSYMLIEATHRGHPVMQMQKGFLVYEDNQLGGCNDRYTWEFRVKQDTRMRERIRGIFGSACDPFFKYPFEYNDQEKAAHRELEAKRAAANRSTGDDV